MTTQEHSFDVLLRKQADERRALADALLHQEELEARLLSQQVNSHAGTALAEAIREVERQIKQDRGAGNLEAAVLTELPSWAPRHLPQLDEDDLESSRKSVVVVIPRTDASSGHRDRLALALFDVTDAVFPDGNR